MLRWACIKVIFHIWMSMEDKTVMHGVYRTAETSLGLLEEISSSPIPANKFQSCTEPEWDLQDCPFSNVQGFFTSKGLMPFLAKWQKTISAYGHLQLEVEQWPTILTMDRSCVWCSSYSPALSLVLSSSFKDSDCFAGNVLVFQSPGM